MMEYAHTASAVEFAFPSGTLGAGQGAVCTMPSQFQATEDDDDVEQGDAEGAALSTAASLSRNEVLLVDDNLDALEMMADVIDFLGYRPHSASDADAAMEIARRVRPSVALLDIGLPRVDGYELGRRLLAVPELAGIRLIALTGHGSPEDRARSQNAGFVSHLVKPVDLVALEALLKTLAR